MRAFENSKDVDLMIWETNPKKRNTNNEVKFLSKHSHEKGDVIVANIIVDNECFFSCYVIDPVLDQRTSADKKRQYFTATTEWKAIHASKLINYISDKTAKRASDIMEKIAEEKIKKSA